MKYRIIILAMVAALSLPAIAQWNNNDVMATAPTTTFQSTSTLGSSNSAYSSNPSFSSDGTATIRTIGARRNEGKDSGTNPGTPDDDEQKEEEWQPIGDAVWPLLLLALAYVGVRARRRVVNKV